MTHHVTSGMTHRRTISHAEDVSYEVIDVIPGAVTRVASYHEQQHPVAHSCAMQIHLLGCTEGACIWREFDVYDVLYFFVRKINTAVVGMLYY